MLRCMTDKYEIHGYSRHCVKAAERLVKVIHRWIIVTDIKSGFVDGDMFIVIHFIRMSDLHVSFRNAKEVARRRAQNREVIKQITTKKGRGALTQDSMLTADTTPSFVLDRDKDQYKRIFGRGF